MSLPSRPRHVALIATCVATVIAFASARADEPAAPTEKLPVEKYIAGRSVENRPIHCEVYGNGPDVLMIIATIHGNESAGTPLVAKFAEWLTAHPEERAGRTVVIIPVANPDGFAANKRFNTNEVDLNRNYPADNWGIAQETGGITSKGGESYARRRTLKPGQTPLSEPESRVLMQLLCRYFPNRVVSIHQPIACIDYDGPAAELAAAMATGCPLPVKQLGSRPGSLGSFVGTTLRRPIITWELPKDAPTDAEELWTTYGKALIAALRFDGESTD